jgi:hypothetical protein
VAYAMLPFADGNRQHSRHPFIIGASLKAAIHSSMIELTLIQLDAQSSSSDRTAFTLQFNEFEPHSEATIGLYFNR